MLFSIVVGTILLFTGMTKIHMASVLDIPENTTKNIPIIVKNAGNIFIQDSNDQLKHFIVEFESDGVFSVNNTVTFKMQMEVENSNNVKSMDVSRIQNVGETPDLEYILDVSKSVGNVWTFTKQEGNNFFTSGEFLPSYEGIENFFLIYYDHRGYANVYEIATLKIHPSIMKLQVDTNRALTIFAEQTAKNNIEQKRTNYVIEGLSWIIVSWIPFGATIEISRMYYIKSK